MSISPTNLPSHSFPTGDAISPSQYPPQTVVFNFRISGHSKKDQFSIYSIRCRCNSDNSQLFILKCSKSSEVVKNEVEGKSEPKLDSGSGGDYGNDRFSSGGGGGGGDDVNGDEEEFGPIVRFDDVMREAEMQGAELPSDMLEAAQSEGIRSLILSRYLELQIISFAKSLRLIRWFMVGGITPRVSMATWFFDEVVIDTCCATFAEVQKRGKDFWSEFELYAADVLVGVVVDIALVGMLAPYVRIGKRSAVSSGSFGHLRHACASLPSSVFEVERPGSRFSLQQRVATYFYKGVLYGSVGFGCGLIGQGIANMIMSVKRSMKKSSSEEDIPIPPLVKSAVLWGVFLAVSSNTRYQIINGLEGIVERSPAAKRVPLVAMAFTVGVRFANNIYGGMQFVDWAKLSGVQ